MDIENHRLGRIYLGIDPPYPDETFSSVLNRAACMYDIPPKRVIERLLDDRGKSWAGNQYDLDNPIQPVPVTVIRAFPNGVENKAETIRSQAAEYLFAEERRAFCPLCFREDVLAGRIPYFRSAWARVMRTFCDEHLCPLAELKVSSATGEWWRHPWCKAVMRGENSNSPAFHSLMKLAKRYEQFCVSGDSAWPGLAIGTRLYRWEREWEAGPQYWYECRLILWLAFESWHGNSGAARWRPVSEMSPRDDGWFLGSIDTVIRPADRQATWSRLRTIGAPSKRRAIFLLAACSLEKDMPIQDLGAWPRHMKSCSSAWWNWLVWNRLAVHSNYPWLKRIAAEVGCNIRPGRLPPDYSKLNY